MDDILDYYIRNLNNNEVIFKKMSFVRKAISITLFIAFILSIGSTIYYVESRPLIFLVMLSMELLFLISLAVNINAVSVKYYGLKATWEELFTINWNCIDKYKVKQLKKHLEDKKYSSPEHIEKLIEIYQRFERETKFDGIIVKLVFSAGLIAITNCSIQWRIINHPADNFWLSIMYSLGIILVYCISAFIFEISMKPIAGFFTSLDSKKYKKIIRLLDYVLLEVIK
jgi:hypothetical protein